MQCEHAQEFISEYVTGEMDTALAVTLENHLNACVPCHDAVDGLRRLWATLDQMPTVEPPPSFHASVMKRICDEDIAAERAGTPRPRAPAWRGLLQSRTLAYAAVALAVLLSAELVQVQRAALGPLGLVLNVIHPVPLLRSHRVEWMPNGLGGGTLTVQLQAHSQVNGALARLHYHIQLNRKDGVIASTLKNAYRDGEVASEQTTTIEIPLTITPSDSAEILNVTLTPADSGSQESQTVAIPLAPTQ